MYQPTRFIFVYYQKEVKGSVQRKNLFLFMLLERILVVNDTVKYRLLLFKFIDSSCKEHAIVMC